MRLNYTEAGLKLVPTKKEKALADKIDRVYNQQLNKLMEEAELTGFHTEYDEWLYDGINALGADDWEQAMYEAGYAWQIRNEARYMSTDRAKKLIRHIKEYWWNEFYDKIMKEQGTKAWLEYRKKQSEWHQRTAR